MLSDNPDIEVIGEAKNGEDAIEQVRRNPPDVVLMDIRMPGIGGLEATRKILRLNDTVRVVVVTGCADNPYPARVMQAGASGYITKGADIHEIIRAVRKAHTGQRYISPDIAQQMALEQGSEDHPELTLFQRLSEREREIALMVVNCRKVQDISDALCLSPKTVNTYRYRVFEKLGISSDVELALMVVRLGFHDASNV
jgi:DNA-binding NarL/FixJ family response regulator